MSARLCVRACSRVFFRICVRACFFRALSPLLAQPLKRMTEDQAARPGSTLGSGYAQLRQTWPGSVGFGASDGTDGRGASCAIAWGWCFFTRLFQAGEDQRDAVRGAFLGQRHLSA